MTKSINIDLGCGKSKKEEYIGLECGKLAGVDIICNLNEGLHLKDNSVDRVHSSHNLEHLNDPLFMLEEIHRVLKKGGIVEIIVPHWSWYGSHTFMHKAYFHSKDFDFFEKDNPFNYYTKASFKILSKRIRYGKGRHKWWAKPICRLIDQILNRNQLFSEQFLVNIFMPESIRIVMKKDEYGVKPHNQEV
jgi:SAM-dependent methyltransferase